MGQGMLAIISDIHANAEALEVVLADIARQNIAQIYCLGDIIGYGPNPVECLDKALAFDMSLLGNHEEAVLNGAFGMNQLAKEAIDWTREQLQTGSSGDRPRWDFLQELPLTFVEDDLLFVHGSPRDPTTEYILRSDTEDLFGEVPEKVKAWFSLVPRLCFVGHTHTPGIITEDSQFLAPHEFGHHFRFDQDRRYICNVGSVGQPRDGNNKACYTTYDRAAGTLTYHRLDYPFSVTAKKIRDNPRLGERNAERLEKGC